MGDPRDPAFWEDVACHPDVAPHVTLGHRIDVGKLVSHPLVLPFRYDHGGFLLVRLDSRGRIYELHTLFKPAAWGRPVYRAAVDMFRSLFKHADVVMTHEVEGWWRSRPPRTFGFKQASDFQADLSLGVGLSTWVLTKADWEASPACKRGA